MLAQVMVSYRQMDPLIFFYPEGHEAHFEHGHPERPERVEAMRKALQDAGWWENYPKAEPLDVPDPVMNAVHLPLHLDRLEAFCRSGRRFDADTYLSPSSWGLARQAAGGGSRSWILSGGAMPGAGMP